MMIVFILYAAITITPAASKKSLGDICFLVGSKNACNPGLVCTAKVFTTSVCQGTGKFGEGCIQSKSSFKCNSGLTCNLRDKKCYNNPRLINEPCANDNCKSGLFCVDGVCAGPGKFVEFCIKGNCEAGLACNPQDNKCYHFPRLTNEPCNSTAPTSDCRDDSLCLPSNNTCQPIDVVQVERCLDPTHTIMVAVKPLYKTDGVTTTSANVTGNLLIMDDFSTNEENNLAFQIGCQRQKGANFRELHYDAQCTTDGNESKVINLIVSGQPRCYAKSCVDKVDDQALLDAFSLRPTEERADLQSNSKENWTCTGELRNASKNICNVRTKDINQDEEMNIAAIGIKGNITDQTAFLGLFKKAERLVSFRKSGSVFNNTCQRHGGAVTTLSEANFVCGRFPFKVLDFTVCLFPLCGPVGTPDTNVAIAQQFQTKLKAIDTKDSGPCVISSAFRVSVGTAAIVVGTILSTLF
jgi:hypothetical protein